MAQIRGSPVYVITSVALIPLSSQLDAEKVIGQTQKEVQTHISHHQAEDVSIDSHSSADEDSEGHITDDGPEQPKALTPPSSSNTRPKSQEGNDSVAQDVISKRGQYGRFAESWFSREGWTNERRRAQGMSADNLGKGEGTRKAQESDLNRREANIEKDGKDLPSGPAQRLPQPGPDVMGALIPKLLKTTKMLFASRSFFFSYDYDITRRSGDQTTNAVNVPLYRSVDPLVGYSSRSLYASPQVTDTDIQTVLLESELGVALHRKW